MVSLVRTVWNPDGLNTFSSTHASIVKLPGISRFGACGTKMKSSTPSRLKACPTLPGANVAPFCSVPLLPSCMSFALPSPGHQLIMFGGGGSHVGDATGLGDGVGV